MSKTISQTIADTGVPSGITVIIDALVEREKEIVTEIINLVETYTDYGAHDVVYHAKRLGLAIPDDLDTGA